MVESLIKLITLFSSKYFVTNFFFFFYLGFLSRTFTIHETAGEGGGYLFNSSLPLRPASQTLRYQPGDYCRELTSAHSWQPDSNWEPLISERKSLTMGTHKQFLYDDILIPKSNRTTELLLNIFPTSQPSPFFRYIEVYFCTPFYLNNILKDSSSRNYFEILPDSTFASASSTKNSYAH